MTHRGGRTLPFYLLVLGWSAVAAGIAASPVMHALPPAWLWAPLALTTVLFGLPHGAADHLAVLRALGKPVTFGRIGSVLVLYLTVSALVVAVWQLAPAACAIGFIGLTWFHWGQGDLHALAAYLGAGHLPRRSQRVSAVVVRGSLPMFVPLLAHPEAYVGVLSSFAALFDADAARRIGEAASTLPTGGLAAAWCAIVAAYVASCSRSSRAARRDLARDVAEVAALAAFFAVLPPVFAVGVYFGAWHAPRHVARLADLRAADRQPVERSAAGDLAAFAWEAAPLTAVALVLLVLFGYGVGGNAITATNAAAVYLVGISALTVPHVAVVTAMDGREKLWR